MSTLTTLRQTTTSTFSIRGINRQAASAGLSVFVIYLFAGLTVQVGVLTQLGLSGPDASGWFFITWMTTGAVSLVLSLVTRQPVSINLSIPALVFLAGAAGGFTLPEILGANLVVGVAAIGVSVFRLTESLSRLVPGQIAIAVFAGSMLGFMFKTADLAISNLTAAGPALAGYGIGLIATKNQIIAIATAAAVGFIGVLVTGGMHATNIGFEAPITAIPAFEFSPTALLALGIPMFILTAGVGNIQSLAVLKSAGYQIRSNIVGAVSGVTTVVNALGGGHPAAIGSISVVVASGPAAGHFKSRYWAIALSSVPVIFIAMLAVPVIAVVQALPIAYTLTIGALAFIGPFRQTFAVTRTGDLRLGALAAFGLAALPLQALGMPMAFWALIAGIAISGIAERSHLMAIWKPSPAGQVA
jgi:benzoate membrane transport protein